MIRRWRDELDGTWHESGDLDQWDVEQDAKRAQEAAVEPRRVRPAKPRRNYRRVAP